jgi:hypothetical protein
MRPGRRSDSICAHASVAPASALVMRFPLPVGEADISKEMPPFPAANRLRFGGVLDGMVILAEHVGEQRGVLAVGQRVRHGGSGPAVLLLHGHLRTHVTWHKVASMLAERFTVVCPDLGATASRRSRRRHPATRPAPSGLWITPGRWAACA